MRISDWSSDVCSSDLVHTRQQFERLRLLVDADRARRIAEGDVARGRVLHQHQPLHPLMPTRPIGARDMDVHFRRPGREELRFVHEGFVEGIGVADETRSEEHTSELKSLMRISYAVFCLTKKTFLTLNLSQITT